MALSRSSLRQLVLLTAVATSAAQAADLMEVLPVTDQILMLHYRDGHIAYNGVRPDGTYAPMGENKVYYKLLDAKAATDTSSYRISSSQDAAYTNGVAPVRTGYKAKGAEFNTMGRNPPFLREYWVYAELPSAMQSGRAYTIELGSPGFTPGVGGLADNFSTYSFTYDTKQLRSPTIHVSQVGFTPEAEKFAYFSQWMGTFDSQQHKAGALNLSDYAKGKVDIVDLSTGKVVRSYNGLKLQKLATEGDAANGNWTKADVYALDFSDFTMPGRYAIVAERMGCSYPFEIGTQVFEAPFRATMRSLFLQRKGIYKDLYEYGKEYPRSHHPDMNKFVYGDVNGEGTKITNPRPVTGIWGWYGDAGDWDCYPTHYNVPYTLLLTYDIRPGSFKDGDIGNRWREKPDQPWVEEAGNGVPDLLDEARWLVEFYRRARHQLMEQKLGTGGVPGYVGRDADAHFQPSWNDKREMYVSTEQAPTTYALAGTAAYLAHCLNKHQQLAGSGGEHPESAAWMKEAMEAFAWAEASGDKSEGARQQRQIAAAALYLATSDANYQDMFKKEWNADGSRNAPAWIDPTGSMIAAGIYLISCKDKPNLDRALYDDVKANIIRRADNVSQYREGFGFRVGGIERGQSNGMNLITAPRTIFQALAYEVTADRKYLGAIESAVAFVFGGNHENICRLTGVGQEREESSFVCDAWYLLDFKHQAYRNPIFPGYSSYGLYAGWDVGGPGSEKWALSSTLPNADGWPLGERRMRNRYSIAGSEFTIHQNQTWYAFATGYLLDPKREKPVARLTRPTVELRAGDTIRVGQSPAQATEKTWQLLQPVELRASASDGTERVRYFCNWHFIGESSDKANGFRLKWHALQSGLKPGEQVQITAVACDRYGEISQPTPGGEKMVRVVE